MKNSTQIAVGIAFIAALVIILALTAFYAPAFYAPKSDVAALSARVDTLSKNVEGYYADVDLKIGSVEKRVTGVEAENDTLRALAQRNARCVKKLHKRLTETRGLVETHGRKINDLSETVFKAAYGAEWDSLGQKAWDKYVLCGNQNLWDEVVKLLTPEQMQKIIQVDQLNQRIEALENSSSTP